MSFERLPTELWVQAHVATVFVGGYSRRYNETR